nr:hypothetical protein B0A51_10123 [Rachicladosporium sp. CCFEE 5018]
MDHDPGEEHVKLTLEERESVMAAMDSGKDVPWFQVEHKTDIAGDMRKGTDFCELYDGARKLWDNVNPEAFKLPLGATIVCMKVESLNDMKLCLEQGWMANNLACTNRMSAIWEQGKDRQIYLLFSVKGTKQFCAMGQMIGDVVANNELEGWDKENCTSLLPVTFIYVKNVPFALLRHLTPKKDGQPVSNMWNSMVYEASEGREVMMIYVRHPRIASMLLYPPDSEPLPLPHRLGLDGQIYSGRTIYSASSLNSRNDRRLQDPRSAVTPYRDPEKLRAMSASSWRTGPTQDTEESTPSSMGLLQSSEHKLGEKSSTESWIDSDEHKMPGDLAATFMTPDEATNAEYQSRQKYSTKKADDSSPAPTDDGLRTGFGNIPVGFAAGRASFKGSNINTDWRDSPLAAAMRKQTSPSTGEIKFSKTLRHVQTSHNLANSFKLDGLGVPLQASAKLRVLSPSIASEETNDPFKDPTQRRVQALQRAGITPTTKGMPTDRHGTARPCAIAAMDGARSELSSRHTGLPPRTQSPLKQMHSAPILTCRSGSLSATAPDFVPKAVANGASAQTTHQLPHKDSSSTIRSATQATFAEIKSAYPDQPTPNRRSGPAAKRNSPGSDDPIKIPSPPPKPEITLADVAKMSPARQAAFHQAALAKAQAESILQEFQDDFARKLTVVSPPESVTPPEGSIFDGMESQYTDSIYDLAPPTFYSGEMRDEQPSFASHQRTTTNGAHTGHRRAYGDPESEGFSGSFDMRMDHDVAALIATPQTQHRNGAVNMQAMRTPAHRHQQGLVPPQELEEYGQPMGSVHHQDIPDPRSPYYYQRHDGPQQAMHSYHSYGYSNGHRHPDSAYVQPTPMIGPQAPIFHPQHPTGPQRSPAIPHFPTYYSDPTIGPPRSPMHPPHTNGLNHRTSNPALRTIQAHMSPVRSSGHMQQGFVFPLPDTPTRAHSPLRHQAGSGNLRLEMAAAAQQMGGRGLRRQESRATLRSEYGGVSIGLDMRGDVAGDEARDIDGAFRGY